MYEQEKQRYALEMADYAGPNAAGNLPAQQEDDHDTQPTEILPSSSSPHRFAGPPSGGLAPMDVSTHHESSHANEDGDDEDGDDDADE